MDFLFEKNLNFFKTDSKNNLYYIYKTYDDVNTENQNGEKIMNNQYHKRVLPTNNYNEGQKKVTASFLSSPMELLEICYGNLTDAVVLNSLIFSATNPKSKTYHETIDGKEVYSVSYGSLSSYLGLRIEDVVKALSILDFYGFIKLYGEGTIQKFPYSKGYSINFDTIEKIIDNTF